MTERTIIGKRYVVESAAGCVVTRGRGRVLCDVAPGMAGKFVATDGRVVCSDPLAVVREAQELEALPASGWFICELSRELVGVLVGTTYRLWWREGQNKLFIMTQLTNDDLNEQVLAVAAKYVPEGVTAEVYNVNKYAHCVNIDDILAVNADYKNDLTSEGEWIYLLPSLGNTYKMFEACKALTSFNVALPKLSDGGSMFDNCQLDKDSVLRVLNSIPAYTSGGHHITLGIHVDYQSDEEVLAAIADAEAKGWTVSVQWNGTPRAKASATYRMRRQQPVYAKLAEDTEWPDGTIRPTLDWGHYVTNWQENGYQEFASIEEAKEYFNITE